MKRIILLLLCLAMVAGLIGCAPKEAEGELQVGFGRADITPQFSTMLWGYPGQQTRWSNQVLDPLYATCVAFTDAQNNTILTYTVDLLYCGGSVAMAKKDISNATGVAPQNIMISATHTHSGPVTETNDAGTEKYVAYLQEQMVAAAVDAMADRKSAEMYTTSTRLERMTFVRHYRMNDGTVAGSNFGSWDSGIVKHMQEADNEMQLIRFKREGGKDVVLVNWQTHPLRTGSSTASDISADLVGAMRMALEPELGCHMAYFSGACGDLNPTSMIVSEKLDLDYMQQGAVMAKQAILAMDTMDKKDTGKVQILRYDQEIFVNKDRSDILLYAFSIGDVGFIAAPYEMFDTNGMELKSGTVGNENYAAEDQLENPYEMTIITTIANGYYNYIPSALGYENGGYATDTASLAPGTGEQIVGDFLQILNELHD